LDLAKIESGRIEVKSSRVSLGGLVHDVVEALRPVAAEKVIALEATIGEPSIQVWADRDKINQVLTNLIGNAIKFTPVQGRVTVSASRNGGESVQVSVSDTGPGVAPDEKEKIFAKFYQIAEVNGENSKGTGLGLAIAKALVELHGGTSGSSASRVTAARSYSPCRYQARKVPDCSELALPGLL